MTMRKVTVLTAVALGVMVAGTIASAACKVTVALEGANVARRGESTLGDLVADAARAATRADVALIQAGLLRAQSIPVGEFTPDCINEAVLYPEEHIVVMEMSGNMLQQALEHGLSALPSPSPGFLQVSGLTVVYRSAPNSPGQRIVSILVGSEALVPGKTYVVALPASVAKGDLGYFRVLSNLRVRESAPSPTVSEALLAYARTHPTIAITPGQRLQDLAKPSAGK